VSLFRVATLRVGYLLWPVGLDSKHWAKKSCHSGGDLAASAIFGPPEQTLHSLGLGVCALINFIAAALLLADSLERNVNFYNATLIFDESLERNAYFVDGNVDFLRKSRTKRSFLSQKR